MSEKHPEKLVSYSSIEAHCYYRRCVNLHKRFQFLLEQGCLFELKGFERAILCADDHFNDIYSFKRITTLCHHKCIDGNSLLTPVRWLV